MSKSIRAHLFQIIWLGLLPVGIFAASLLYLLWSTQEQAREQSQFKAAQSLAMLIEGSIDSAIQQMLVLGELPMDTDADRRELYQYAQRALHTRTDLENFILSDVSGKQLFNLDEPYGNVLPSTDWLEHQQRAIQIGRPFVSDMFVSKVLNARVVRVHVPVVREGKVAYVISARFKTEAHGTIVRGRGVPEGGRVAVWDRNMVAVAATRMENVRTQAPPSSVFLNAMREQEEGVLTYPAPDGERATTAWAKTSFGWRVSLRLPANAGQSVITRYLGLLAFAWLVVLAVAARFALKKAQRLSDSLEDFERQAARLNEGVPAIQGVEPSGVLEIDRAAHALTKAGTHLIMARTERESAFEREKVARREAEEGNRARDAFLAMLGHELRNPMAAISNATLVINEAGASAEQRQFALAAIARQSHNLKRMVDDLLDVGRVMAGKINLQIETFWLDAAVQRICADMRTGGSFDRHDVRVDLSPVLLQADATRVEQIVVNLITNAIRHTPAKGAIQIRVAAQNSQALIEVSDTGDGIKSEDRERIFELFYQAQQAADRPNSGLGIGLTLVKRLVEMHGGTISLAETGSPGATFIVTIPLADQQHAIPSAAAASTADQSVGSLDILVVEDNPDARESMQMLLELAGHKVVGVGDATGALKKIETFKPQVVLTDIGLPGVDGFQLGSMLRDLLPGALLVAITGYGSDQDVKRAHEAGFDAHLTKPVDFSDLEEVMLRADRR